MNAALAQARKGIVWNKWLVGGIAFPKIFGLRKRVVIRQQWQSLTSVLRNILIMSVGLLLAGILGWIWASLGDPYIFPLKNLQVSSSYQHVQAEAVREAATPYLSGNFFTINIHAVRKAVEQLPWVRHAEVRRIWPASIQIVVQEQAAVATWNNGLLLNDVGEPFQVPAYTIPNTLPQLNGPDGSSKAMILALYGMNKILSPLNLHITRLVLDNRRAWTLVMDNGMNISLGRGSDSYTRLSRFVHFYPQALHNQEAAVARVDLRYSNGFAVQWKHIAIVK